MVLSIFKCSKETQLSKNKISEFTKSYSEFTKCVFIAGVVVEIQKRRRNNVRLPC
jgi:hypothetical protein